MLIVEKAKETVVPYLFVRRGVPVREDIYPESSACEVGWPVPFLAAFISPVLPPGTHLLLGEQRARIQSLESESNLRPSVQETCVLTATPPRQLEYSFGGTVSTVEQNQIYCI